MKFLLYLTICLLSVSTFAQRALKKELDTITTVAQAEKFLETKKSRKNKILIFNEEKHKTKLATKLLSTSVGSTEVVKTEFNVTHYKVVDRTDDRHYRLSYIYFDGNKIEASKIVEYKNNILKSYEDGVRFDDLAKRYSMDRNAKRGGDSGWLKEGSMPIEVENEAFNLDHKLGEIYTVRIPEPNGFYVILKTERIKKIKEIKVLKVIAKD
ncbi:peptidylprolyl isomerase [Olleya namhaensis]|uniref:PPIC-type PPIASE domain-containing protein n=1 Tax=Olleya namhaensis TaxID=1144750 RepID=A0A1I3T3D6_9FLAO|nr:peptidylprolyl isomerase [Olleya namhaensis]SFJ65022.1 PPIC-type PPIASE domain-containing protein [Olleya namhaensis]